MSAHAEKVDTADVSANDATVPDQRAVLGCISVRLEPVEEKVITTARERVLKLPLLVQSLSKRDLNRRIGRRSCSSTGGQPRLQRE